MRRRRTSPRPASCPSHVDRLWFVRWSRRSIDPRNLTTALATTRRMLRAGRYDVVHTHTPVASLIVRLAVPSLPSRARPAVVYTAHGFHFGASERDGPAEWLFSRFERLAGRWTDRLIVINGGRLGHGPAAAAGGSGAAVPASRHRRGPRLVPTDGAGAGRGAGPTGGARAGRRRHAPRHAGLLRSRQEPPDGAPGPRPSSTGPMSTSHSPGRGPLERSLRAQAEQLGVAERVHFLGIRGGCPTPDRRVGGDAAAVVPGRAVAGGAGVAGHGGAGARLPGPGHRRAGRAGRRLPRRPQRRRRPGRGHREDCRRPRAPASTAPPSAPGSCPTGSTTC